MCKNVAQEKCVPQWMHQLVAEACSISRREQERKLQLVFCSKLHFWSGRCVTNVPFVVQIKVMAALRQFFYQY